MEIGMEGWESDGNEIGLGMGMRMGTNEKNGEMGIRKMGMGWE